jgi:hypothetical protein
MATVFMPILLGVSGLQIYITGIQGFRWIFGTIKAAGDAGLSITQAILRTNATSSAPPLPSPPPGGGADAFVLFLIPVLVMVLFAILIVFVASALLPTLSFALFAFVYIAFPVGLAYWVAFYIPEQKLVRATERLREDAKSIDDLLNVDEGRIVGQAFRYDWTLCADAVNSSWQISDGYIKQLGQEIRRLLPANKHLPQLVMEYALEVHVVCMYANTKRTSVIYCGLDNRLADRLVAPSELLTADKFDDHVAMVNTHMVETEPDWVPGMECPFAVPLWSPEDQGFYMSSERRPLYEQWLLRFVCTVRHEKLRKLID